MIALSGAPPKVMMHSFIHRETIRWKDLDCQGVLNNAVYLTLFEQARYSYFKSLKLMPENDRFPFFLGETSLRFLRPGRAGMALDIAAQVTRLGNKSFDMRYEIQHDGADLATGSATLIWIDEEQNSCRIPDIVRKRIRERDPAS